MSKRKFHHNYKDSEKKGWFFILSFIRTLLFTSCSK